MASVSSRTRGFIPGLAALALITALFFVARLPAGSAETRQGLADRYRFTDLPIAMPAGYRPTRTVREVNPAYRHMRSWISSVGAAVALNDLTGHGRPDGMCLVDPRTDQVVLTYAPTAPAADRFTPFVLDPAPLPTDSAMAPMGCAAGDFNGDARMDLLVYYWGRTPVMFLARSAATAPSPSAYEPVELIPQTSLDGRYHGPRWNTNAVNIADFDGTGRPSILVANYFPDSDVLDPRGRNNVVMNDSMSNAKNAGGAHVLRWYSGGAGDHPVARYVEQPGAIPYGSSTGWTLAASSADLTGDGRPELYLANDFGKDHLFFNVSTPGAIRFSEARGTRGPNTAKSFQLGRSSFKGMGVDFADLDDSGGFDMLVSNITTAWGLEESNFAWINQAKDNADMRRRLAGGVAPFAQQARRLGLAWTGWGWDVKAGDFRNSGDLEVVQAEGFIKGRINRWPWLQEMAMANDDLFTNPAMWPDFQPGDDVAGDQPIAFYAKGSGDRYTNIVKELGLAVPIPTRGIATADTRGDGALDFAVARQWGPPVFYANDSPRLGHHLTLHLYRPVTGRPAKGGTSEGRMRGPGTPAYGATVEIRTPDGRTRISQLDGGGGHSGKRSFEVRFGLGEQTGPVQVTLRWCDTSGRLRGRTLSLLPGAHTLLLDSTAVEVETR